MCQFFTDLFVASMADEPFSCMHLQAGIMACLHVPSPSPCPSPSQSKFNIVPMVSVRLRDRMGTEPIVSVKWTVTIGTTLNFDGDGHGDRDGTCKQTFSGAQDRDISFICYC